MRRHFPKIFIWALLSFGAFSACSDQPLPTPPNIIATEPSMPLRIGLSDSAAGLEPLARLAYDLNPGQAALHFITGNDRTLLEDIDAGRLSAAVVYTLPETDDYWFTQIAIDGLVLFTHPEVQLAETGFQEARALFAGRVKSWSTLSLIDIPISIYSREPGSGARIAFDSLVMAGLPVAADAWLTISEIDMINATSNTPGAIGYGMRGSSSDMATIAIEGVEASLINISDESYPLSTPLYFVSSEQPSGDLQLLLKNLLSEEGQFIIGEKYGRLR